MADSGFAVKTGMETSDAALPRCNEKTLRRVIVRSYLAGTHGDDFMLMFAKLPESYGLEALTAYEESWAAYFTGAQHPSPHKDETMPQIADEYRDELQPRAIAIADRHPHKTEAEIEAEEPGFIALLDRMDEHVAEQDAAIVSRVEAVLLSGEHKDRLPEIRSGVLAQTS